MATIPELVRQGILVLLLAATTSAAAGAAPGETRTYRFEKLDRSYGAFITDLAPVTLGAARIALSSPEHTLTLLRHSAALTPLGNGELWVDLEVRLVGHGKLLADVTFGRVETRIEDELAVPVQSLQLSGRVAMTAVEDGYLITTRELQPSRVDVRIESRLARRLFDLCHQMVLVLVSVDCPTLEASLSALEVPLPPVGESYLLPDAELTAEEIESLDALLAANR